MAGRLRRVATTQLLVAALVLIAGAGLAAGALVGFGADTQTKTSTYAGGWLDAPTALQPPAVSGYGATLTWTPGTHDLTGQALYGTDRGTTSNCTGATYATQFATGLAKTLTTTTDNRGATANGHWLCYQIQSTRGSWSTGANFSPVQVGLVPVGISVSDGGGNTGQIENSDTITLTFNQNVSYSGASTISVCAFQGSGTSGVILLGDTGCGSATDAATIGSIGGLNIPNNSRTYPSSTATATNNTVVITLGGAKSNPTGRTAVSGTGAFTYSGSSILSTAGSAGVCVAANCTWSYSGGF